MGAGWGGECVESREYDRGPNLKMHLGFEVVKEETHRARHTWNSWERRSLDMHGTWLPGVQGASGRGKAA